MREQDEKYGVTGSVTLKKSSEESVIMTSKLEEYLKNSNFYESEESGQTRERVLGRLDFLLKQFVDELAPKHENKSTGGKIFTFGSYRLGVHDRGADIDALCVVPKHVTRNDFFCIFYEKLQNCSDVTDLSKVEDTFVPLIKMKFSGIPIDLTFARLNIPVVKDNITLLNDYLLKSMHEKCIVSLNGSRVTDAMLNLIPSTAVFHCALRAIKLWAKRRYVYGASYGYFGGVAYAICVARICQMYPNYCAYDIICKFFETYSAWKWPNPVILKEVQNLNYHYKVWDPKIYPADKYNKMPVITPVYPTMCATSNVTQSTSVLIINEFERAHEILKNSKNFIKIFNFTNFFKKHKLFIKVDIKCYEKNEYLLWNGFIESKIRILANKLENIENILSAIPFPKCFTTEIKVESEKSKNEIKNEIKNEMKNEMKKCKNEIESEKCKNEMKKCKNEIESEKCKNEYKSEKCKNEIKSEKCKNEYKDESCKNESEDRNKRFNKIDETIKDQTNNKIDETIKCQKNNKYDKTLTNSYLDEDRIIKKIKTKNEIKCNSLLDEKQIKNVTNAQNKTINNEEIKNTNSMQDDDKSIVEETNKIYFCSSFFIAIDVVINKITGKKFYVNGPITEFLDYVNTWNKKTDTMDISISAKKKKEVLNFVKNHIEIVDDD